MKPWYKSRTVWTNGLTLAIGVVAILTGSELLPPRAVATLTAIVLPILNLFLRWLTDQPITSVSERFDYLRGR